jgi:hypothetical protein
VPAGLRTSETRFRYNPDVKSLPGIMPAVISGLLILISAMLSTLSVVRENELGSILNLYVTSASGICLLMSAFVPSQIDRRHLPHFDRHDHSVRPFFRHDRPGVVAGGRRALRRNCAASGATLSAGAEPLPQDHQLDGLNRPRSGYENLTSLHLSRQTYLQLVAGLF